jgi:prepilin-type N-terminal cleavage/methylation domain-containing protein
MTTFRLTADETGTSARAHSAIRRSGLSRLRVTHGAASETGTRTRGHAAIRRSGLSRLRVTHGAASESGMTLVELVVVLAIMAVLMTIAIGSYLGARQKAEERTAQANVRAILPAISAYHSDHGTYETMTFAGLESYDQSLDPSMYSFGDASNLTASDFCVQSTAGGETWRRDGPDADVVAGACP